MATPVTSLHILRLMLQIEQNLSGLQRDMHNNALSWQTMATSRGLSAATLAEFMNSAATSYQTRLSWLTALQADAVNWPKVRAMWGLLGGTAADFSNLITPITAVANQLGLVDKSSYAAILSACSQILAAINAPLSLWPE